jgi:hypothetical protein
LYDAFLGHKLHRYQYE